MTEEIEYGTLGSSFEDFLKEQNTYEETTAEAIKRVLAFQLIELMNEQQITKAEMAKRLDTNTIQLNRLLDPGNESVQLSMLMRAAQAVGRTLRMELA